MATKLTPAMHAALSLAARGHVLKPTSPSQRIVFQRMRERGYIRVDPSYIGYVITDSGRTALDGSKPAA